MRRDRYQCPGEESAAYAVGVLFFARWKSSQGTGDVFTNDVSDTLPSKLVELGEVSPVEVNCFWAKLSRLAVFEEVLPRILVSSMRRCDLPERLFREDLASRRSSVSNSRKRVRANSFVPAVRNPYNERLYIFSNAEAESSES